MLAKFFRLAVLISLAPLASSAEDVRGKPLSTLNLTDMNTVQEVRARLSNSEAVAFANFALKHNAASARFCGQQLAHSDGRPPVTVGEAIRLTLVREMEARRAAADARKPKAPGELARLRWDDLISERDSLIDAHSILRATHGSSAESLPVWQSTEAKLADVNRRLTVLKPQVFGEGS